MEILSLALLLQGIAVAVAIPSLSSAVFNPTFIDRDFNAEISTNFKILTPQNHQNPVNFNLSHIPMNHFNKNRKTMIVIHGFSTTDYMTEAFKKACFEDGNHNVNLIGIDWTAGSSHPIYVPSANRVERVGKVVADFIERAAQRNLINLNDLELIGHSLGAHVSGFAGKHLKRSCQRKLPLIIGLDPAGPLFRDHNNKLQHSDAKKVVAIHTNDDYGQLEPFGGVDIYLNGGKKQPGLNDQESHCFAADFYKGLINIERPILASSYRSFFHVQNEYLPMTQPKRLFHGKPLPNDGSLFYIDTNSQKSLMPEFERLDVGRDPPPSSFGELQQCSTCNIM